MQNAQYVAHEAEHPESNEPDSLFGICQAVGEDLNINPFFLRVALIGLLFLSPALMLGAYLGLGALVAASRLLFPKPHNLVREEAVAEQPALVTGHVQREQELIAA